MFNQPDPHPLFPPATNLSISCFCLSLAPHHCPNWNEKQPTRSVHTGSQGYKKFLKERKSFFFFLNFYKANPRSSPRGGPLLDGSCRDLPSHICATAAGLGRRASVSKVTVLLTELETHTEQTETAPSAGVDRHKYGNLTGSVGQWRSPLPHELSFHTRLCYMA